MTHISILIAFLVGIGLLAGFAWCVRGFFSFEQRLEKVETDQRAMITYILETWERKGRKKLP